MRCEVAADRQSPGDWRVECFYPDDDGECSVTIFCGPSAQERAENYAAWIVTNEMVG